VNHDCGTVIGLKHQFNMAATYEEHSVNNMFFFIPDRRLENWSTRDRDGSFTYYNPSYAPAVAMLSIPLKAAGTQNASEKNKWDITLTWSSNLNAATGNVIPQKFNLYIVDDAGNRTLLKQDFTDAPDAQGNYHYTYTVDKETKGRIIRYVVEGAPLEGEFTPVASNEDLVEVPGLDPNQRLQLGLNVRPVSDYRLNAQLNVYCNHLDVSNATGTYITETQLTKPNARMELYRHWTDADGKAQAALVATIYKFAKDGDKGYTYTMTHSNQDHPQKSAVYGPSDNSTHFVVATGSTDGKIDFGKLEVWDQFSASTSQNQQPGRYTYDVRYLWDGVKTDKEANPDGVDYFYSTAVPVEVYKTEPKGNNQTFTAEQVEADHVLNAIDRATIDSSKPAVTLSLENNRDINYYKVYRLELDRNAYPSTEAKRAQDETGYANMSGIDRYDVFENGNFINTVNTADGAKIADETAMQSSDASTYARRMVPVIWTNRYNSDGSVDATAQNTYGAPIVTVQRVGVTAKLADGSSVETSNFAFSHNGVTGRYYKVPLSLQAIVPSTLRPVKYRIWRSTPDGVAMEGNDVAAYQKRLDQRGSPAHGQRRRERQHELRRQQRGRDPSDDRRRDPRRPEKGVDTHCRLLRRPQREGKRRLRQLRRDLLCAHLLRARRHHYGRQGRRGERRCHCHALLCGRGTAHGVRGGQQRGDERDQCRRLEPGAERGVLQYRGSGEQCALQRREHQGHHLQRRPQDREETPCEVTAAAHSHTHITHTSMRSPPQAGASCLIFQPRGRRQGVFACRYSFVKIY
jgi:hypothetical protein